MRFLEPSQLLWALTALVPIVLFLLRRKPRRVPVSSLLFFKSLAREYRESAWLRRLKRLLALLLTLLVIAGAVGALAHLVISPPAGEVKSVVLVVDRSASMLARDEHGVTRLQAAVQALRTRLAGLPGGVSVALIAFDRQAEIVTPTTYDRRVVERALEGLQVRPMEGEPGAALRLASQVAGLESEKPDPGSTPAKPASAIWFASDSPAIQSPGLPQIVSIPVPLGTPRNVGITGFAIRQLPLEAGRCEAFVQLQGVGPEPCETKVEVRLDGALTAVRSLTLNPGSRESLLLPLDIRAGKLVSVRAVTAGDQLAEDNEVEARLPDLRALKVLWVSRKGDPFTELALTALSSEGELSIFRAAPEAWPPQEPVDAVIFQGWLPRTWPTNLPAIVIDPPPAIEGAPRSGPVQAARLETPLPVSQLRATRERHPLLYGVATPRLALSQTAVLAAEGPLEPLWTGPAGPILAAGDSQGQRVVVMGFAPELSENLPLSASYPMLLGNAIQWVSQPKTESTGLRIQHTGDTVTLRGTTLAWNKANGFQEDHVPIRNGWAALSRIGLWQTDGGDSGSAALLSSRETLLPAGSAAVAQSVARTGWLRGEMSGPLLWLILGVLLLESWLFHRHAVH